jgi:hypothetical protein
LRESGLAPTDYDKAMIVARSEIMSCAGLRYLASSSVDRRKRDGLFSLHSFSSNRHARDVLGKDDIHLSAAERELYRLTTD